jgi:hypothetical protein
VGALRTQGVLCDQRKSWGRTSGIVGAVVLISALVSAVSAGTANAGPPSGDPQGTIYVSDAGTNQIDIFPPGAHGNVAPERIIGGPDTGLNVPADVKVNAAGDVFVADFGADSITEYAPGASGDASPICTISGSNTGLVENDDMSIEPDGTLVVGDLSDAAGDPGAVLVFPPGSCGNVTPTETIAGSNTGFNTLDGVGTDATGTIFADSTLSSSIQVFPPGATGNVAPEYTISGSATGLGNPDDIIVGFDGKLYVSSGYGGNLDSVTVYSPGASGNATPVQNITGSNTLFGNVDDLAVDSTGAIYTTDASASGGAAMLEWNAGATGNVAPNAVLQGANTTFSEPEGVFVAGPSTSSSATLSTAVSAKSITLGGTTSDTATLSGGSTAPAGSLVFKLFGPNDPSCTSAPAFTSPAVTVSGDKSYPSPSFTPKVAGTYSWQDEYSGDAHNSALTSSCNDPNETVAVGVPPTTVSTVLDFGDGGGGTASVSVPAGTAVQDFATLSGTNANTATGTITYNVYSDAACTQLVSGGSAETISGGVPGSQAVTLSTPGTYYWQAVYSGDSANAGASSTCGPNGEVETVQPGTTAISLTTALSGGGKSGTSISVTAGTGVTDNVTATGTAASSASGAVTYNVYSDAACTQLVSSGSAEAITTAGTFPPSQVVTLSTPGTYYWRASYTGDATNAAATSTCGAGGEVETVAPVVLATTLTTSLSGGGKTGTAITVPAGTAVTDLAALSGTNAAKATGTVTYNVYSDSACTKLVKGGTAESISTAGTLPKSAAVTLVAAGTYYWTASYSGDATNQASVSKCGSEKLAVMPLPATDTMTTAVGKSTATATVTTTVAGDLLVALVAGRGPSGTQTATVSGGGVTWHFAGRENAGRGDVEVWTATAGGILKAVPVKATAKTSGFAVTMTVVAVKNAAAAGALAKAEAATGAPKATLKTAHNDAWVLAMADDSAHSVTPKPAAGQFVVSRVADSTDTFWAQATSQLVVTAGTSVTISDSTPTADPWDLIVVEVY